MALFHHARLLDSWKWAGGVLLVGLLAVPSASAESWTDLRGTQTIEAQMLGMWGDSIVLRMSNGKRVSVKLSSLRGDSRIQANRLNKEILAQQKDRVQELASQRVSAAAPAPDPLPQPPAAPPYEPPQKDAAIDKFLTQVDDAIASGHLVAIYDSLPPSYRRDVDELVKLAATKCDRANFQTLVSTLQRTGDLVVTRQRWLLSSPRVQALPPSTLETMERQFITLAGIARVSLGDPEMSLDKLQSVPFGEWIKSMDEKISPYVAQLNKQASGNVGRDITVESAEGDRATVMVTTDTGEQTQTFKKVEGYWVPESLAMGWADLVKAKTKEFSEAKNGSILGEYAGMVEPVVGTLASLEDARNATDFHAAIETTLEPFSSAVTMFATVFGKSSSQSRGGYGPSSYGPSGYGGPPGDYVDDSEMEEEMREMEAAARAAAGG